MVHGPDPQVPSGRVDPKHVPRVAGHLAREPLHSLSGSWKHRDPRGEHAAGIPRDPVNQEQLLRQAGCRSSVCQCRHW